SSTHSSTDDERVDDSRTRTTCRGARAGLEGVRNGGAAFARLSAPDRQSRRGRRRGRRRLGRCELRILRAPRPSARGSRLLPRARAWSEDARCDAARVRGVALRRSVRARHARSFGPQGLDPLRAVPRARRDRGLLPRLRRVTMADAIAEVPELIREEDAAERL